MIMRLPRYDCILLLRSAVSSSPKDIALSFAVFVEQAVARLRDDGVKDVLVTLGEGGSMMFEAGVTNADAAVRMKCFQVDNVVDTTGAGDCFRAA